MAGAMPQSPILKSLLALVLSAAAGAAPAAPETVHFTSLDGTTNLIAYDSMLRVLAYLKRTLE